MGAAEPEARHGAAGAGEPYGLLLEFADRGQHHAGAFEHELPQGGGPHAEAPALEEPAAQGALDAFELGAQGGLGETEPGGGLGQAARVGNSPDRLQMPQFQVHSVSLVLRSGPEQESGTDQ